MLHEVRVALHRAAMQRKVARAPPCTNMLRSGMVYEGVVCVAALILTCRRAYAPESTPRALGGMVSKFTAGCKVSNAAVYLSCVQRCIAGQLCRHWPDL